MRVQMLLSDQWDCLPSGDQYLPLWYTQRHVSHPLWFTHTPWLRLRQQKKREWEYVQYIYWLTLRTLLGQRSLPQKQITPSYIIIIRIAMNKVNHNNATCMYLLTTLHETRLPSWRWVTLHSDSLWGFPLVYWAGQWNATCSHTKLTPINIKL